MADRGGEAVVPIRTQWPSMNVLGFGVWWAWIWLCYNSTQVFGLAPQEAQTSLVHDMYLSSTTGIALATLLAGIDWRRTDRLMGSRAFLLSMGAAASLATVLLSPAFTGLGRPALAAVAFVTGLATSALCLKSGHLYGQMGIGYMLTASGMSIAFAALVFFAGLSFSGVLSLIYTALLPLASAFLMCMQGDDPVDVMSYRAVTPMSADRQVSVAFWRLVAASATLALVAGVARGVSTATYSAGQFNASGKLVVGCSGLIALAVVTWINTRGARSALKGSYSLLMVAAVAVTLASGFTGAFAPVGVMKESLWCLFFCMLAYLAFRFDLSSARTFGFSQAAYFAASTAGWLVGGVLGARMDGTGAEMAGIVLAFAIVVVFVLVFRLSDIDFIMDHARSVYAKPTRHGAPRQQTGATAAGAAGTSGRSGIGAEAAGARDASGSVPRGVAPANAGAGGATPASAGAGGLGLSGDDALAEVYALSQREIAVGRMFAGGRSANWIADALVISPNTVRSHIRAVYVKLDVHTRQELIDALTAIDSGGAR